MTKAKHEVLMMFWEQKVSQLCMEQTEKEKRARGSEKKKQAALGKATRAVLTLNKEVRAAFLMEYLK